MDHWLALIRDARYIQTTATPVRAQYLLWTLPHILDSRHLAQFTSAIHKLPEISITGLVLGDQRAYAIKSFDPSTASSLFMHSFHHLQHLLCYGFLFYRGPPLRMLRMRLPFFASITVLQLLDCTFQSARAMLDVVWACPSLATLAISRSTIKSKRSSAAGLLPMSAAVEHLRACRKLTSLYVDAFSLLGVWDRALSVGLRGGGRVFGCAVTTLIFKTDNITDPTVLDSILWDSFPALRSVTVVSHVDPVFQKSSNRVLSLLHVIALSRPIPGVLKTIILEGKHDLENNSCCKDAVGTSEEVVGSEKRLRELLVGLAELVIRLDECKQPAAHRCAAYIWSVLPWMHGVLRFEYRSDWHDGSGWRPYTLQDTLSPNART